MSDVSQSLFERSRVVSPGGVHSPVRAFKSVGGTPVFFKSAEGAFLESVDGQRYIDFCQSFGPLILGHRDPEVAEVVHETVNMAWSFGTCEPYSLELAEWMVAKIPWAEKVRFVNSGTEAVMSALRLARAFTGRNKILKFEGCYHGHVDSLLVKAGSGLAGETASDSAGVSQNVASETILAPLDDENAFREIFLRHRHEIAAVIIEPMPANYGLLLQRREFLQALRELTKEHGVLLVFDEVISGFRVALGGMAQRLEIVPDLVTYGKVMGGGFPVGCYGGRRDIMELIAPAGPVYQAGTLSANPIGMRAGLATLKKVVRDNVYDQLEDKTKKFVSQLESDFKNNGVALQVAHFGSVFWLHGETSSGGTIRRLSSIPSAHGENYKGLFHQCLSRGIYLAPSGYEVGFLSLAHTDEILDQARVALLESAMAVETLRN